MHRRTDRPCAPRSRRPRFLWGNAASTDAGDGPGIAGIKVNVGLNAQRAQTYAFLIDFNAAESIVQNGAGQYLMKAVLVGTAPVTLSTAVTVTAGQTASGAAITD
jgi:hypothetical protein